MCQFGTNFFEIFKIFRVIAGNYLAHSLLFNANGNKFKSEKTKPNLKDAKYKLC